MRRKIIAFIKMSRAYFLFMPILPYLIGVGMARREVESLDLTLVWQGYVAQMLVQMSVSYLNDYWDIETDRINRNRTPLSGGSGELATGILPPGVALVTGCVLQGLALLLALALDVPRASWVVLLAAILMAQFYTMPPLKLVYRGLGEISAAFVAVILVPLWGYTLQTAHFSVDAALPGVALIPFIIGMLLGIAAPDYDADKQVGKHTLVVIVGLAHLAALYAALLAVGYILALVALPQIMSIGYALAIFLNIPFAVYAWMGFRSPVRATMWGWLWLVMRPGLVALVTVAMVAAGVWSS